jgi:hypothetical protein
MSTKDAYSLASRIIERWGFPVLVSLAVGFVLRNDVLLPMVQAHTEFLKDLSGTQRDIVETMQEQTRLLYALQPRTAFLKDENNDSQN